ncbi:MAG: DUF2975 domain-containing protein [Clostridia bacterium]|nr:DUF2975 domain-containing protein [Clostridia bacterium]
MISIIGEKGLTGVVKRFLDLVFVGGTAIWLSLPITLKWYLGMIYGVENIKYFRANQTNLFMVHTESYWFLMGFLYISGFFSIMILHDMRKIFKSLNKKDPFIIENVKCLHRIAVSSFGISICYIIKIFTFNTFLTIILTMVFIIAGLFTIILAEVFKQAVKYKEENDLTI